MNLGENIYKYRTQRNMSQGDLADALNVSRQSVSKWENNNAVPDLERLVKMSELFGITLDELVGKERPAPEEPSPSPVQPVVITERKFTTQKVIGIILVCAGALFLLMALSAADASVLVSQFLFGAFFLLCGGIYLKAKQHPGLLCLYALYLFLWLPMGVLAPNYIRFTFAKFIQVLHMLFGGCLFLWGWHLKKQESFLRSNRAAILFFSVLAATIMISFLFLLFPGLLPTPGLKRF